MWTFIQICALGYVVYCIVKEKRDKEKARAQEIIDFNKKCDEDFKNKLDETGMSNEDRIRNGYGKYVNK